MQNVHASHEAMSGVRVQTDDDCERIWKLSEAQMQHERAEKSIDLADLMQRVDAFLRNHPSGPKLPQAALPTTCAATETDKRAPGTVQDLVGIASTDVAKGPPAIPFLEPQEQEAPQVFEIAGSIKWYDASKGYGFIAPDSDRPDVLLHVTCLRAGGFQMAYEGARVYCEVLQRPRGLQAFRILSMDESTAIHPSQLPPRTHVQVTAESDWVRATVTWYNRVLGYGFLSRGEGTEDMFVHADTVRRFGFTELRKGQAVEVRWGTGCKGCMAAELRPIDYDVQLPPIN